MAGPVSSDFATVLDPKAIKAKRRLFMTATPRYFTGRVLRAAKEVDYEVASMDDETRFGAVFHRLAFSEAIERDLLTDYQVAVIGVDDATYRDWAGRGTLVTLDGKKTTDARSLAGQIGLAKAMKKFDLQRVISFHSRVRAAKSFAASMPAVLDWMPPRQRPKGSLWSQYASGEMSAGERGVLLQHLKRLDSGERGLLANARCLSEGVDVPALDGVAFIDPRRSEVDIVQAVGRAIRKSDTKNVGTIVIPVFIDTDEDAELALDSSVFKPVWDVIKALRAHDTELGEQLDELRRELGRRGGKPKLPSKIHVDVPATVGLDFVDAFDVRLVDATTASWEFWFGLLERYVAENETALVPVPYKMDGYRLGGWCSDQRGKASRGELSDKCMERLNALPGWTWEIFEARWELGFQCLVDYAKETGRMAVPQRLNYKGFPLGSWVTIQRQAWLSGTLGQERFERLTALPDWTWTPEEDRWIRAFAELERYVSEHGDALVNQAYVTESGLNLGTWANAQRIRYRRGTLETDRVERLSRQPGWVWDATEAKWERAFQALKRYAAKNGTSRVPRGQHHDGVNLGMWVTNQRAKWKSLSEDRRRRLESLPGWVENGNEGRWELGFKHLENYVKVHGKSAVPRKFLVDGYPLGTWVDTQRNDYRRGNLAAARQKRLADLPGWDWAPKAGKWDEGYQRLAAYIEQHGNAHLTTSFVCDDGYLLGAWVANQRNEYTRGELDASRAERLSKLPGWVWKTHEASWEEKFSTVERFIEIHGHARVPAKCSFEGQRIGAWVAQQRMKYKQDVLREDRARRLSELPGWEWNAPRGAAARLRQSPPCR